MKVKNMKKMFFALGAVIILGQLDVYHVIANSLTSAETAKTASKATTASKAKLGEVAQTAKGGAVDGNWIVIPGIPEKPGIPGKPGIPAKGAVAATAATAPVAIRVK